MTTPLIVGGAEPLGALLLVLFGSLAAPIVEVVIAPSERFILAGAVGGMPAAANAYTHRQGKQGP